MKSKRGLMTLLVGVAMLAMPLTAAAKDHGRFNNPQARNFAGAHYVAAAVNRHEFRHGGAWTPAAGGHRNWNWNHRGLNDRDADDYQNYGNGGYYAAPAYAAPVYAAPAYAAPMYSGYGGGNGCGGAQRVMRTYARDRATGHPAAAYDLLRQNQWAMRSGCAGGAPMGGGLLGGLGGLGGYGGAQQYVQLRWRRTARWAGRTWRIPRSARVRQHRIRPALRRRLDALAAAPIHPVTSAAVDAHLRASLDDKRAPSPPGGARSFHTVARRSIAFSTFARRSSGVRANDENCSAVVVMPAFA